MKFNKWTLGLAALGVVSLASASSAKADGAPPAPNYMEATMKGISISGYVDTSVEWNMYPGTEQTANSPIGYVPLRSYQVAPGVGTLTPSNSKQDGFNLNVIELNIEKPMDEAPAASGFKVQMLFGPDAVNYNTSANASGGQGPASGSGGGFLDGFYGADFAIKQAYVAVRAPVGNGIDFKIGVFDTIIGYEVFESGSNPNFTRSWGWNLEPTEHTGILASYKINDSISVSAGIANTLMAGINARNVKSGPGGFDDYWCKSTMASITLTAPSSWGFLGGSALYSGYVYGFNGSDDQLNYYLGAVVNTPLAGLTAGLAYDYVDFAVASGPGNAEINNIGLYTTYKINEKLTASGRFEYGWRGNSTTSVTLANDTCYYGLTGTIEYDIWANVMSRLEIRHEQDDTFSHSCGTALYLNMIYKF